jgi:hypothetical protein
VTNRVFVDMDGVVADFAALKRKLDLDGDRVKNIPGAFKDLKPLPGAIEAVRSLIGMGFEVWIATKPPTGNAAAYADKAAWILEHLPELKRRIIMTHDKGLLGDDEDYLIDDRVHKANCKEFKGVLIDFGNTCAGFPGWPEVLEFMRHERDWIDRLSKLVHDGPPLEWPPIYDAIGAPEDV